MYGGELLFLTQTCRPGVSMTFLANAANSPAVISRVVKTHSGQLVAIAAAVLRHETCSSARRCDLDLLRVIYAHRILHSLAARCAQPKLLSSVDQCLMRVGSIPLSLGALPVIYGTS